MIFLVAIVLCVFVIINGAIKTGIIMLVLFIMLFIVISMSTDTVIKTILFHYAETGELPEEIENKDLLTGIAIEKK